MAEKNKQTAAGIFSTGVCNPRSRIPRASSPRYRQTRAEFSITILETDSSGWAKANSPDIAQIDPLAAGRQRQPKVRRLAPSARSPARPLDGDSRAFRRARSGRLSVLRFRGHGDARPALVLHEAHGQKVMGDNITIHDDVYPSAAIGPAVRRRRHAAAESFAGGSRRAAQSGLRARHRQKNESQAHRPRLPVAQRYRRSALQSGLRRGENSVDEMVPPPSAASWSRACGTSAKSIPTKKFSRE